MDTASMLERFYELHPRRRVIFLNCENEKYFDEYVHLNIDILSECLLDTTLDFEVRENEIFISGENIYTRLLFECAVLCASAKNGAILKPYAGACDIMKCACRINAIFGK